MSQNTTPQMQLVLQEQRALQSRLEKNERINVLLQTDLVETRRLLEQTNEIVHRIHSKNFCYSSDTPQGIWNKTLTCDLLYDRPPLSSPHPPPQTCNNSHSLDTSNVLPLGQG